MIQEIVQNQKIDIVQINPLVLDHLQFHVNQLITLFVDIAIAKANLIPIEVHHVQSKLNFHNQRTKSRSPDYSSFRKSCYRFFPGSILEFDSTLELIILHTDLHQDHVHHLLLHQEGLLKVYDQNHLILLTTTLKIFFRTKNKCEVKMYIT